LSNQFRFNMGGADRGQSACRSRFTIALALAVALSGCGDQTIPVHGSVQREGNPLTRGRIVLTAVGGGKAASGDIQSDGTFRTTIERGGDLSPSGTYRIRVIESSESERGRLFTSHVPPADMTLEIGPGQDNEFNLHIRAQDGWKTHEDN
jgi:hypothetical protein